MVENNHPIELMNTTYEKIHTEEFPKSHKDFTGIAKNTDTFQNLKKPLQNVLESCEQT